jgi:cell wall-associated NlpC family hydrolase
MKIVQEKIGILGLFLAVFGWGVPAFAVESTPPAQSIETPAAEILRLQLGPQQHIANFDCSHLVHALYERVGLHYQYATSHALYRGIEEFQRVPQPESGDLVVWRGHTGIVVDPSQHSFLSALKTGVKTSSYISRYWKRLGPPRFFRFAFSVEKSKEEELDQTGKPTPASVSSAPSGNG